MILIPLGWQHQPHNQILYPQTATLSGRAIHIPKRLSSSAAYVR